jgi:CelD/BcsL family acetyltransferase involved in cellulose biosynthesis
MDRWNAPQPVTVQAVSSEAGFDALETDWERLHAAATTASVFTSWPWLRRWWQHYGKGQPLHILVASVRGETVGILPLYVQTQRVLGVGVRMLRLVGSGGDTHPDDLGAVLAPGREASAAAALAGAALALPGWDVLHVADMDPKSELPAELERACRDAGLAPRPGVSQRIAYIDLPASWEAFLASMPGSRRSRLKRARSKLDAGCRHRFFAWNDYERLDEAVDRLIELHHLRWREAGGSASFVTPEYIGFHRSVIKMCAPRDWLRLYCQEIDGQIVAMTYCYRFRDRVFLVQAGFDPAQSRWKPGNILLGNAIEHAIGEGNVVLDFLRGDHRYKEELASGMRDTVQVTAHRPGAAAWAYRARREFFPALKAKIRGLLPTRASDPHS